MSARPRWPWCGILTAGGSAKWRWRRSVRVCSSEGPGPEDHPTRAGFQRVVQRRDHAGGAGGLLAGARLHGDPAARLPHLGADAAGAGRLVQGDRSSQRLLPAVHPDELPRQGSRARRGVREGSRAGDAHSPQGDREGWRPGGDARPRVGARGAARHTAHVRDDHLRDVRQVDSELPRSAAAPEPVVQHRALGVSDPAVLAHHRVSLAGGTYGARDGGGGRGGGAPDARRVPYVPGAMDGDARDHGPEDGEREVRRCAAHLRAGGADAGQQGAAGGHVAQSRPELRQGVRRPVPDGGGRTGARVEYVLGRFDAHDRWPGDDAFGRQRPGVSAQAGTGASGDRADLEVGRRACSGARRGGQGEGRAHARRFPGGARCARQPQTGRQVLRVGGQGRAAAARARAARRSGGTGDDGAARGKQGAAHARRAHTHRRHRAGRDPGVAVQRRERAARGQLRPGCDQAAVSRVHAGRRRVRLRRVLRRGGLRGRDPAADGRDRACAARSRVPLARGAADVHVVRQTERRGGGVGAGVLAFDPALLRSIAERVGTPTYVYSANLIRAQYHALHDALKDVPHRICYSVKANGNLGVLKVLRTLGAGADIVSVGELRRALAAGFEAGAIVFSGVGKTAPELDEAIRAGVGYLNIESSAELDAAIPVARRGKRRASLGIRVNPDVATETHPYTKTGEKTAKFGVPYDEVVTVAQRIVAEPLFALRGLAMHLGSQITDVEPYHRGTVKLLELVAALRASSITTIEALDVGGGLGVRYLVANAGVLLTKVLYRKHAGGKEFVVVDAGMTDFVRPSHYNAHHEIMPLQDGARPEELVNIVGPICESGDFLALDRKLPAVEPGEYLAVLGTGAYGFVMSSTYNQRPRPPEILVEGDRYYVARQRETLDDLLRGEVIEPPTWYQGGGGGSGGA